MERYTDFADEDRATGITVYCEHRGMLCNLAYVRRSEKKLAWYEAMGMKPNGPENDKGERLVTSKAREDGAIDSAKLREQVRDDFEL